MLTLQSLPLSLCPAAVMLPVESRGPRTRRRRKQPQPSVQTQHLTPGQRPALEAGVQGPKQLSGAWSVTGHACPDPGHTKASPGGCVSALPIRQRQEKAGIASSTSCRHTQFLSAFVLIEKRTHRFLWEWCLQGEHTENGLFYYVQTNIRLFEVTEYLPSHTHVGIQGGNPFLAFDVHQTCLDRTGQINGLISFPPPLLYIH